MEEIFRYLEQADKPCIFAIDEFQQIAQFRSVRHQHFAGETTSDLSERGTHKDL